MRPVFKPLSISAFAVMTLAAGSSFGQQPPPPPQQPPPPPMARADADATLVATGQVRRLLVTPAGDVDGLLLADGTQVAFRPQPADRLAVKAGDRVQVQGWRMPGATVVAAATLMDTAGKPLLAETPPAPPADPASLPALTAIQANGKVEALLRTDRGDVNGVLLDNGTIVRFPPRPDAPGTTPLRVGQQVVARGWGSRTAAGTAIEANAFGESADRMQEVMPRPRPGDRPGPGVRPGPRPAPPAGPAA